jgi:hypothetical protein
MSKASDFHVRLPEAVSRRLVALAQERVVSRNVIIVSALEEYFGLVRGGSEGGGKGSSLTARAEEESVEGLRKELFELKRRMSALREDVEIVGELLSFFIFHWIGYTPRLEREERLTLAIEAKERHDRFLTLFAKKLALGELSLATVISRSEEFSRKKGSDPVSDEKHEEREKGVEVREEAMARAEQEAEVEEEVG